MVSIDCQTVPSISDAVTFRSPVCDMHRVPSLALLQQLYWLPIEAHITYKPCFNVLCFQWYSFTISGKPVLMTDCNLRHVMTTW